MSKLLIIDDEKDLCLVFQKIFQEEGHSVILATTGEEGIVKARHGQPDLIFLDLKMPSMDGITCLKKLRSVSKASKIVVLTGFGALHTVREAMRLGAYDYTSKPFDLDLIREIISEAAHIPGR